MTDLKDMQPKGRPIATGSLALVRGLASWRLRFADETVARALDPARGGTVVTIGNFDGLHLGHVAMLARTRAAADRLSLPAVVVSFEPLPHEFFARDGSAPRLQGLRDRVSSMAAEGIDRLLLLRFDSVFSALTADDFIERVLVDALGVRHLVVGDDFRFGRDRAGGVDTLLAAGERHGFTLERADTVEIDAGRCSSSRLRERLTASDLDSAARLLGRPYRISGRVVHGEKVGRQLGFPTANIALGAHRPPLRGVFAVEALDLDTGRLHEGVANLGERPTVGGRRLLLEVHALDGSPDLYGHHLAVDFHHPLRGERRFDSLAALTAQIALDADAARQWFANRRAQGAGAGADAGAGQGAGQGAG